MNINNTINEEIKDEKIEEDESFSQEINDGAKHNIENKEAE